MKIKIEEIKIPKRVREDIGDLSSLKNSMRKKGLINPITITEKYELLAGSRRLSSAKELGWKEIDCHIVPVRTKLDKFEIEVEENTTRKDFNSYEIEKIRSTKEYLTARGLKKLKLWFLRLIKKIISWFKRYSAESFNQP